MPQVRVDMEMSEIASVVEGAAGSVLDKPSMTKEEKLNSYLR